ncbi:MAG: ribosomal protein S18-alanine N-acetyltransferase [Myxococcales bacterium]|nr:ribosomal protein S18-alanine N-acetyltransferase [Myxococcales bacterium]
MTPADQIGPAPLILPARRTDLEAVHRIAQAAFPQPWPRSELEKELERDYSELRVLRAAAGLSPVVAFLNDWRIARELQIMNVATDPEHRGRGYGSALLRDLMRRGRARADTSVTLEVRVSNAAAIRLYERHGYERVGLRPCYYSDNGEDALVMRLWLSSPGEAPALHPR